jgi:hypothetical protein
MYFSQNVSDKGLYKKKYLKSFYVFFIALNKVRPTTVFGGVFVSSGPHGGVKYFTPGGRI